MKKNKRKLTKNKEPSLFIKLINIYFEQAKRRKALRILEKQSWSFDFLALLLVKASKFSSENLSLTICDTEGKSYTLTYDKAKKSDYIEHFDDDIFNHLDDDVAMRDFILNHSVR